MDQRDQRSGDLYFYRSARPSPRHRRAVAMYLVERLGSSSVVARIESIGLVPRALSDAEVAVQGLRRGLVLVGPWDSTTSRRHTRIRVRTRD